MRPAIVPRYVQVAESAMEEYFNLDLWMLTKKQRTRIILAALDAERLGTPEQSDSLMGAAVYDCWKRLGK